LARIISIYKAIAINDVSRIVVRYLDNESDMCTVTSNEELQEAFCSFSTANQVLKLVISIREEKKNPERECNWGMQHPWFKEHGNHPWFKEHGKQMCQFRKLHRDGINLMEETKYQAAREVFLEQLKEAKNEWQRRFPYYNIACCESLLGNISPALENLEKAVNCGFRNLAKIREDPDLNSLRSTEKYQQLINSIAERKESKCGDEFRAELRKKICQEWKNRDPNSEGFRVRKCHWKKFVKNNCSPSRDASPEVKSEEKAVEEPKVEIPVIFEKPQVIIEKEVTAPHHYEKSLLVFEEMGFLDRDQNIAALTKVNGDAKLAISVILGL